MNSSDSDLITESSSKLPLNINQIKYNARNLFWIVYGVLIFLPIEIFYDGLYLSYLQIAILFFCSQGISKYRLTHFFLWMTIVSFSIFIGRDAAFETLINPMMIGLVLISPPVGSERALMIKRGVYISATIISIYLAYLLVERDLNVLSIYITDREWAKNDIPFFGNGLAMLFVMAMLLLIKDKQYILFLLITFGALMTTSRMPVLALGLIILSLLLKFHFRGFIALVVCIILLQIGLKVDVLSSFYQSDFDALYTRVSYAEDRAEVFNAALLNIYSNPFFGVGSEKLIFYEHAHNSYLQVMQKFGLMGFCVFLLLVFMSFFKDIKLYENLLFVFVFIAVTSMQIGLLNPNFMIIVKVYAALFFVNHNFSKYKYCCKATLAR
jgi:O-antigen ligase